VPSAAGLPGQGVAAALRGTKAAAKAMMAKRVFMMPELSQGGGAASTALLRAVAAVTVHSPYLLTAP
jgi:hypothetical protein